MLVTSARSPFHFSLHASDPDGSRRRLAQGHRPHPHLRPDGLRQDRLHRVSGGDAHPRQGATQIIFDKDRGLEILVRALGGEYCALKNGEPTGFNPLKLPPTPLNVEFLKSWLRVLVRPATGSLTVRQQADLDQALRGTLALELPARRLSRLMEFLDSTDSEGLYARLSPWCAVTRGDYAWVFDNEEDVIVPRLAGQRRSSGSTSRIFSITR